MFGGGKNVGVDMVGIWDFEFECKHYKALQEEYSLKDLE
jgi:hypothetical protein